MTAPSDGPARLIRGHTLSFAEDRSATGHRKGVVVVGRQGRILWHGAFERLPARFRGAPADDFGSALVLPGFIDAHIHFPQHRMLAAPGRDLLDWLNRHTFPEEARYRSRSHAQQAAEAFLDRLLANGTTAALAFSSVHKVACDRLFAAAERRNMALIAGKSMMDRNAPDAVLDTAETGARETADLIGKWHGVGRNRYAITPRFAVTSTQAQLEAAGAMLRDNPDCLMQTHLSENLREIESVARLFPSAIDYTDVYDRCGLLGPTSLFAHGIHLSERECARLSESGSSVVHCPTSNTFLGSGLCDVARLTRQARPVGVGLATDIGGGTSYSMLATMGEARKVAMLNGARLTAHDLFHMATLGNARLIGLGEEIGALESGRWADIAVLDPEATPVLEARHALSETLEDVLFALAVLGDDRAVRATYVAGERVHGERP